MKPKTFLKVAAAGSLVTLGMATAKAGNGTSPAPVSGKHGREETGMRMKVGTQRGGTSAENLEFLARHGVFNMDGGSPKMIPGKGWDLEDSLAKREMCEKYGIKLEAYYLPLSSKGMRPEENNTNGDLLNIMLGKSPERDREIEMLQQMIQVAAKTGVELCTYNTAILPILRTGTTLDPKRGNV
jgi:mannonate dehydratase